jgi:hypothetical protein
MGLGMKRLGRDRQGGARLWQGKALLKRKDEMMNAVTKARVATAIGGQTPTNGAAQIIAQSEPYVVSVTIEGVADLLFHRWNPEAVDEKARAAKGSAAKKSDDIGPTSTAPPAAKSPSQASICGSRSSLPRSFARTRAR